ncbi:MAG: phospholipase D-like domain-containing protein [Acidobacteria bacterium]|nr:phospholipase D-like domain-containing protein [Acidobacteriota bacterium]MCA1651801.1 phospholipase D-like domain-containing protein [Acidobacteriota bacterium]
MSKPVRRAFLILFIAAGVVAMFLLLAQDQVTLKTRSAVGAAEPRHANYLAGILGVDLTRGNRFTVLTNGDQMFPAMLAAVRSAKRRISFESYIFEAGDIAEQFTSAFEQAARRGVRVQMVIDAVGGSGIDDEQVKRLESAGCRLAKFSTPSWYSLEELNYRTHRKILVIDGETAFTGGAGIDDQWKGNAQDKEHWRDTMVQIVGPLARLIEGSFYENFAEAVGEVTPELDDVPQERDAEGASFTVRSSPTGGSNDLKRLYLFGLASARQTVEITTPYFVTDESSRWALEDAVTRGVKIRMVVEGDITDAMPVKYASRKHYERLMELGIEIHEYQPTMMHTKVMVVDGIWSMFGSANFDNRSLELNDELNVAVTSRDLAGRFLQDFDQDLRASRRLTLETWRKRSLLEKTREKFWSLFGELF